MTRSLTRMKAAATCAVLPLALALTMSTAFAQKAGTYTGTNNEGDEVQVAVSDSGGSLVVTGMSDGGEVYCGGQPLAGFGVGIGLSGQPIVDRKATIDLLVITLYYHSDLKFSGNTVKGTINFAVPIFGSTKEPPKKACAAAVMPQTFTATLGGEAMHVPPPGKVVVLPR